MRSLVVATLLGLSGAALADEEPLSVKGRAVVGPMYDQNPARDSERPPSAGASAVLLLDGALRPHPAHVTTASLDLGARWFASVEDESQIASRITLAHAMRALDWLAPIASVSAKDRQVRNAHLEFSEVEGSVGAELGPFDRLSGRAYGGARRFWYRENPDYDHGGPFGGVLLRGTLSPRQAVSAGWELSLRRFDGDEEARPPAHLVTLDWSYRGRFLLSAGYQLAIAPGDKIYEDHRHRVHALAGMRLPAEVLATVELAYQHARFRAREDDVAFVPEDEDRFPSLGIKLTRELGGDLSIESTVRGYYSLLETTSYERVIATLGLALAL